MSRILILFAHPMLEKSRVQKRLAAAASHRAVTFHDLYELYPDFDIDVPAEQNLLTQHDLIIFQHPLYWYSAPALVKQWLDLVLEHGWAYGRSGKALIGKRMMNIISSGGSREAYQHGGYNSHTIREFLLPFEQTARLCGMHYLPPFIVHGTHRATEADLENHARTYAAMLDMLAQDVLTHVDLKASVYMNDVLPLMERKGD